ncbi:MAG TPA: uroporphyrinogen decarboxylase [Fimbriimonadaceae bacterium]|nr:uroporphyrinogen decarboxylase [Fimbriimonadaceae bacterium]
MRACRGEKNERPPIWLMRQAGRYLPEYREIRRGRTMLETVMSPELSAEITLQPIKRFGFDAAVLFSDLTVPFMAMGAPFEIKEGVGPVVERPVRSAEDIARLSEIDPEDDLPFTFDTIRLVKQSLEVPLVGFTGAPFTLACYLVEGGPSKDYGRVRAWMHSDPEGWSALMEVMSENVLRYARAQIEAGADAVQLFDSWVGVLSEADYRTHMLPHVKKVFDGLRKTGAPSIYFGTGNAHLLGAMAEAGGDVMGVDWRITLTDAATLIGKPLPLQGNLDPAAMFSSHEDLRRKASEVIEQGRALRGHIFNFGHGIFPNTPLESVQALVETVQSSCVTLGS